MRFVCFTKQNQPKAQVTKKDLAGETVFLIGLYHFFATTLGMLATNMK